MARKDQTRTPLEHRYPRRAAYTAGLRAVVGAGVWSALWLLGGGTTFAVISATGMLIFLGYGVIAIERAGQALILCADGVEVTGWRRRKLLFAEITAVRLGYYTTRKDGEKGWMELVVRAGSRRLVVESEIDGFRQIAVAFYKCVGAQDLALSEASERNFAVLLDESATAGLEAGFGFGRAAPPRAAAPKTAPPKAAPRAAQ